MTSGVAIPRTRWKQDLAPYVKADRLRSLGQLASVLAPYLGVWMIAAALGPSPWLDIVLGLVATAFLVRMYSFFHDLTPQLDVRVAGRARAGVTCSASCCSRRTGGGSASTASITRTPATSTNGEWVRSTR